jgi:hypothetical protein
MNSVNPPQSQISELGMATGYHGLPRRAILDGWPAAEVGGG